MIYKFSVAFLQTQYIFVFMALNVFYIICGYHSSVAHEYRFFDPEALLQISYHFGHGRLVQTVAFKYVMG